MGLDSRAGSIVGGVSAIPMYALPANSHILLTHTLLAIKGDHVQIELSVEVDLRELDRAFYLYGGRMNLIDWEKANEHVD